MNLECEVCVKGLTTLLALDSVLLLVVMCRLWKGLQCVRDISNSYTGDNLEEMSKRLEISSRYDLDTMFIGIIISIVTSLANIVCYMLERVSTDRCVGTVDTFKCGVLFILFFLVITCVFNMFRYSKLELFGVSREVQNKTKGYIRLLVTLTIINTVLVTVLFR